MNENAEKWVAALESGEFEQGYNCLRTESGKYCCLGVACELAVREGVIDSYDGDRGGLPDEVRDWLGLYGALGRYAGVAGTNEYLADDNDHFGKSFEEIASHHSI